MRTIYLVRHAEPVATGVLLGRTDSPLSAAGRRQARERLTGLRVQAVYSSALRRAAESARFVACDRPVVALPELNEIDFGEWDGKSWAEVARADPALAARKARRWFEVTPPGGEPWAEFAARVERALDARILRGPHPAAVVAHVAVNAVIANRLDPSREIGLFRQEHCEILEFSCEG